VRTQYAGGDSERMLGLAIANLDGGSSSITVGTKAHPSQPGGL
jgi:hypothetical protein